VVFVSIESGFLTGVLPFKMVKQDSNLFFDGRLAFVCALFSFVMTFIF
jgi:hypothetical protein